jgi:hypothetical protein
LVVARGFREQEEAMGLTKIGASLPNEELPVGNKHAISTTVPRQVHGRDTMQFGFVGPAEKHQGFNLIIRIIFLLSQQAPQNSDVSLATQSAPLAAADRTMGQLIEKAHPTHFPNIEHQRFDKTVLCKHAWVAIDSSLEGTQWQLVRHTFTSSQNCQTINITSNKTTYDILQGIDEHTEVYRYQVEPFNEGVTNEDQVNKFGQYGFL